MQLSDVYLGLGGNIGDSRSILKHALEMIGQLDSVFEVKCSKFYRTSPVSNIPQPDYINAAAYLKTSLPAYALFQKLQNIEKILGKTAKKKNEPRTIDIDILFFDSQMTNINDLILPHPRWNERLFVLIPLLDLTPEIKMTYKNQTKTFKIKDIVHSLSYHNNETIIPLE